MCTIDTPLHLPTAMFNSKLKAFNRGRVLTQTVATIQ
jgi:hypothetical protein